MLAAGQVVARRRITRNRAAEGVKLVSVLRGRRRRVAIGQLAECLPSGGSAMRKELPVYVILTGVAILGVALLAAMRFVSTADIWRRGNAQTIVIRRPNPAASQPPGSQEGMRNISPLATVTISSAEESPGQAVGVADGVVDSREWVTRQEMGGAWIKLNWDRPALVSEIALYDRPDRSDNVLGGTLSFDDGSVIPVPALPPAGTPWRISFPPKTVHWVLFRIDRAEGRNTGLEEIMVFGALHP